MVIENKWKQFAIEQVLTSYDGCAIYLFDSIKNYNNIEGLFRDFDIVVWFPFEDKSHEDVLMLIKELANEAQSVANS